MSDRRAGAGWLAWVTGFLVALTLLAFARTLTGLSTDVFPDSQDAIFNLSVLEWGHRTLPGDLRAFWNPPYYYPLRLSLALSDHLIGIVPFYSLIRAFGGSRALGYNLLLLASFPVAGLATAWVLRRLGRSAAAAGFAGAAFAFAPWRLGQITHLQMLWVPGTLLALWSLDRLLARPGPGRAAGFLVTYAFAVTGGCYLAYQVHLPLAAILLVRFLRTRRRLLRPRAMAVLLLAASCALTLTLALFRPYLEVRHELGTARGPAEISRNGAASASWITPAPRTLLSHLVPGAWLRDEQSCFPGLLLGLSALIGAAAVAGRRAAPWRNFERALLWSAAIGWLLAWSPIYLTVARILPGMDGMRVPTRWMWLVLVGLTPLAARGLEILLAGRSARATSAGIALVSGLLMVETWPLDLPAGARYRLPESGAKSGYVAFLAAERAAGAVVVLPIGHERALETPRMLEAQDHRRPIVNGYSGYSPNPYRSVAARCRYPEAQIDGRCLTLLREIAVRHVVVEDARYRGSIAAAEVGSRFGSVVSPEAAAAVRLVWQDEQALVLEIGAGKRLD